MTRPIKFRAWCHKRNMWLTCGSVEWCLSDGSGPSFSNGDSEHVEVTQFIGLLDKNGKEIFEGDIIMAPDDLDIVPWALGVVSFEDGYFLFKSPFISIPLYLMHKQAREWNIGVEVKGNIYENPELIPEEKE